MKTTDNFALAIRPTRIYLSSNNRSLILTMEQKQFELRVRMPAVAPLELTLPTEFEAWRAIEREAPWALDGLRNSHYLADRGLALRHDLLTRHSEATFQLLEAEFTGTVLKIFETVREAMGAVVLTKAARVPLRPCKSRPVCYWSVSAKVQVPYESTAFQLAVICFPSPIEEDTWTVHLKMPSFTNATIKESQARMKTAIRMLAERGIKVDDVTNGTYIEL